MVVALHDVLAAVADDHDNDFLEVAGNHDDEVAVVADDHDNDFLEVAGNHDGEVAVVADASDGVEAVTDNSYRHHSNSHHAVHSLQKGRRVPLNR